MNPLFEVRLQNIRKGQEKMMQHLEKIRAVRQRLVAAMNIEQRGWR